VTASKSEAAAAARIGAALGARKRAELSWLLRPCFARPEPWLQAGKYLSALASSLPERNGWTIAEHAGDRGPDRTQRLLNRAAWDTSAAMGVVRRFAVAGLDEAARRGGRRGGLVIGALDETGQEKAGAATAGVQRQYLGCAGKITNGINTVHLACVREHAGHALIGSRQWIPCAQIADPVRCLVTGLPLDLEFRTKGQLAIAIAAGALADGIAFDFSCGDEVYGNCTMLREFFEARGQAYVLRVQRELPAHPARRPDANLRGRCCLAGREAVARSPLCGERLQRPALVCLVVAGHCLPGARPADPPPSQDR
jgi:DDE superfamily endonuclease